jgi:DNA-binding response OmpR family regulator
MRVLVIEDEVRLAEIIKRGLEENGFPTSVAGTGEDGLYFAQTSNYDVIILDLRLPGIDGITVCRQLRQSDCPSCILILTALDSTEDKVVGLDAGADDYMVKPFAFSELLARIRALTRRVSTIQSSRLSVGPLTLDTISREVWKGDQIIELTTKEFTILEYFMRHPNAVVVRSALEENVWNNEYNGLSNIIDVYVRRLRQKLGDDDEQLIKTIRGAGYKLKA